MGTLSRLVGESKTPDDEPLLRLAEASGARLITTHNFRHLRAASMHGVTALQPREFLRMLRQP